MQLPNDLKEAIETELKGISLKELSKARTHLTQSYRSSSRPKQFISNEMERKSYLVSRLPATFAAVSRTLMEIKMRIPEQKFTSLLDLGAGPGTTLWAANEIFSELSQVTLIEQDSALIQWGKKLASYSSSSLMKQAHWICDDIAKMEQFPSHDLIVFSYSLNELSAFPLENLLDRCWDATNHCLLVVEPGTPVGFERIRWIRDYLIKKGAHLVAPCPHQLTCPMKEGDWCHFSTRVERTALHRQIKEGSLGHEDEKFSYIAFSKGDVQLPQLRVIRHPQKHSGHINLTLCTREGLKTTTVSKRTPDQYKLAKSLNWGSAHNSDCEAR